MKTLYKIIVAISALIVVSYVGMTAYLNQRFFFNTYINDVDCSLLTAEEANIKLQNSYNTDFTIYETRNLSSDKSVSEYKVTKDMFNFSLVDDVSKYIPQTHDWAYSISQDTNISIDMSPVLNDVLDKIMNNWDVLDESSMIPPRNAYLSYDKLNGLQIVPEELGTTVDLDIVKTELLDFLNKREPGTDCYLSDNKNILPDILSTNPKLIEFRDNVQAELNKTVLYSLGNKEFKLTPDKIGEYLTLGDYTYSIDWDTLIEDFVSDIKPQVDTIGITRNFKTTDGREIEIKGGDWGWNLDKNATIQNMKECLENGIIEGTLQWKQKAVDNGEYDYGGNYIEIDLTSQKLYMYTNNELIVESNLVSGDMAKNRSTPGGTYILTYKTRNATLRGGDYASFVYYWMPFNGGIGLHDATWRRSFGGNIYKTNGSHGCVNLPLKVAETIYNAIDKSYAIICYY